MKIREYIYLQDENGFFHFGDELVRCKECKWFQDGEWCNCWTDSVNPTDFCSYGERREESEVEE
jgi:hypothetical protein